VICEKPDRTAAGESEEYKCVHTGRAQMRFAIIHAPRNDSSAEQAGCRLENKRDGRVAVQHASVAVKSVPLYAREGTDGHSYPSGWNGYREGHERKDGGCLQSENQGGE
jgi:hypothetical protein